MLHKNTAEKFSFEDCEYHETYLCLQNRRRVRRLFCPLDTSFFRVLLAHKHCSCFQLLYKCKIVSHLKRTRNSFVKVYFNYIQVVSKSNARRSRRVVWCSGAWASLAATPWRPPTAARTWVPEHSRTSTLMITKALEGETT